MNQLVVQCEWNKSFTFSSSLRCIMLVVNKRVVRWYIFFISRFHVIYDTLGHLSVGLCPHIVTCFNFSFFRLFSLQFTHPRVFYFYSFSVRLIRLAWSSLIALWYFTQAKRSSYHLHFHSMHSFFSSSSPSYTIFLYRV